MERIDVFPFLYDNIRWRAVLPRRSKGKGRLTVDKLNYGLIGCGRIAPNHITAALNNIDELGEISLCDPIRERRENIFSFLPQEIRERTRLYEDYRDMLRERTPDLVAVATESGKHAAIGLDCIDAGCNVIIEKPIALSIDDARALVERAREKNVKLCVSHQNRFNKSIQKIREAKEAGRFGRLLHGTAHILWNRGRSYYEQAPWRGTWEQDGGCLMNQCIHNIDLLRWMMDDEVAEVVAYTDRLTHDYIQAEDLGLALIRFRNGGYGVIEGTTNVFQGNLEETLYLFGENGAVKAGGKSVNIIENWRFRDGIDDPEQVCRQYSENPPNVYGFGHTPLYRDMIAAVREDRPPYVDGEAGLRALELVLAVYQSAASGKPVSLPLEHCASTDFTGRFEG